MKMKQMIYWFSLLVSSVVVVMNVMVLNEHEFFIVDAALEFSNRVRDEFVLPILPRGKGSVHNTDITVSAIKDPFNLDPRVTGSYSGYLLAKGGSRASSSSSSSAAPLSGNFRRSRTLLGIISANTRNDCAYRKRHRKLFQIWNDTRVCSLAELQQKPEWQRKDCQLVYTFVIGAADDGDDNNITQIVNSTIPLYRSTPLSSKFPDVNEGDITLLNIKENMNEGKSPTFFYFASTILEDYNLDYAMKFDGDSILHLHDWFLFAHHHLPPRPYNRGFVSGALRHKAFWPAPPNPEDTIRHERYWQDEYEGVHLYLAGQCYLMSLDLCKVVANEAPKAGRYMEGHEDHDTSSMAFHSPHPIHLLTIGKSQRFWEHPVKGQPRWERIRKRELARVAGEVFENKQLRLYLEK